MSDRMSFIDWMKVVGMAIIVWGHTGSDALIRPTEPFNPKQLGVAFFVFVLGFSLAKETRPRLQVVFNRLFPIFFVGLAVALLLSVTKWVQSGDLSESNYLPFFFGVNVFFDFFPANPTTWFIGTYIHIILLWALFLVQWKVNRGWILLIFFSEIVVRVFLIKSMGNTVAYMLLTNWMTVFALGLHFGQRGLIKLEFSFWNVIAGVALIGLIGFWMFFTGNICIEDGFPFSFFAPGSSAFALLATSTAISGLYAIISLLLFRMTIGLWNPSIIRFFARNTLFVFIVHMPLIYLLVPYYYPLVPSLILRIPINLALYFLLPAIISEILFRWIDMKHLRDVMFRHIQKWTKTRFGSALEKK